MERLIVEFEDIVCIDDFDSKTSKFQDCIVTLMLIVAIKKANKNAETLPLVVCIIETRRLRLIKNWPTVIPNLGPYFQT